MGLSPEALREAVRYMLQSQGFDRVLRKMKLVSAAPGKIVCELKVEEEHTNRGGTLHGGLTATLVDVVSTAALLHTERAAPGVSVDMNITEGQQPFVHRMLKGYLRVLEYRLAQVSPLLWTREDTSESIPTDQDLEYTAAAKIGEEVLITAQILKQGRNIAFASVDLTNKATGKLIAQGRHTKYLN